MKQILRLRGCYGLSAIKRHIRYVLLIVIEVAWLPNNKAQAQTQHRPITGTVISVSDGRPLEGATVKLKSGGLRAMTDKDGSFRLPTPIIKGTLIVTFIGYQTQEVGFGPDTKMPLIIKLTGEGNELEEVEVSTGYQNISKERATGSFEFIPAAALQLKPGINLLDRLEGNSSILFDHRSSGPPNLQIRGLYTLNEGMAQPLIVLDNFPFTGDIQSLNPADIASVTILKDAAAASIWGARAGNGVIVITTKKGTYDQKTTLTASGTSMITGKPDLHQLPILSSSEYIDLEMQLFREGAYDAALSDQLYPALTPVMQILNNQKEGLISEESATQQINRLRKQDVRDDFERYVYRPARLQQYQAEMAGGSTKTAYRISIGYDKQAESLVGNDLDRYTVRLNHKYRPISSLEVNTSVQYTESQTQNNSLGDYGSSVYDLGNSLNSGFHLPIYSRLAGDGGQPMPINKYRQEWLDTVGRGQLLDWNFVPLDEINQHDNRANQQNLLMDVSVKVTPFRYISVEAIYRYQKANTDGHNERYGTSYEARDLVNLYTNLNTDVASARYPVPQAGFLDQSAQNTNSHNLRTQFNLERPFDGNSHLSVLAGAEISQIKTLGSSQRSYGYNERLNVTVADYVNLYPRILGGSSYVPSLAGFSSRTDRYLSVYANAAYDFQNRFTLSASGRNDAANLFGVQTRNKWKPLYSAGISWNLSNESFYKSNLLPYLKLRLTYGYQGNVNNSVSAYTQISYYPASINNPLNIPFAILSSGENPDLRWESVHQVNAALDFALARRRISGSIEYYRKVADDILSLEEADPSTGFLSLYRNSAQMKGHGLEVQLNILNIQGRLFTWQTQLMLAVANYHVSQYKYDGNRSSYVSSGNTITPMIGYPPYALLSYQWAGLDPQNGNPRGYLNGRVTSNWDSITRYTPIDQLVLHGSALPTTYGNLFNTFRYKNVAISFNMTYKFGYYFRSESLNYDNLYNIGLANASFQNRWKKPGDEQSTNVPSMIYPNPSRNRDNFYNNASIQVNRGDHIRLQQIKINYQPFQYSRIHSFLKNLQLYAYMDQLNLVIWKAAPKGIDPEYPTGLKPGKTGALGINFSL